MLMRRLGSFATQCTIAVILSSIAFGDVWAGEITQVRAFETFAAGIIRSTDPSGIVYHEPSGHLYIADSEISEMKMTWDCENIFEVSLDGQVSHQTYDAYDPDAAPCPPPIDDEQREPAGITYNAFDGFFYIVDDDEHAIMRYDGDFGAPNDLVHVGTTDLEGITSDPATGLLYIITGVQDKVLVYDSNLQYVREFSVRAFTDDAEGIAYDEDLGHLFIVSSKAMKISEFTVDGGFVTDYDISHFVPTPIDPQGLTFGPSSNDPSNRSLYIADGQIDNMPVAANDRDGIVYEAQIQRFDFLAKKKLQLKKHGGTQGTLHSNDKIEFSDGLPSVHTGDLTSTKDIVIKKKNTIDGNVTAGNKLSVDDQATINGVAQAKANVALQPLSQPSSFFVGSQDLKSEKNTTVTVAPGAYDRIEVGKNGTIVLGGGVYTCDQLTLEDDAVLQIDTTNGATLVHVGDKFTFGKRVVVEMGEASSRMLTVQVSGSETLKLEEGARFSGSLVAPNIKVEVKKNSDFKGLIVAKEIRVEDGSRIVSHSSVGAAKTLARPTQDDRQDQIATPPSRFVLEQNYPNPFNPTTTIQFELPRSGHVELQVYNVLGRLVSTLRTGHLDAGRHHVAWNGRDHAGARVPSGVYYYRLQAAGFSQIKRMTLVK